MAKLKVKMFFSWTIEIMEKGINEFLLTLNGSKVRDIKFQVMCNDAGDTYHTAMVMYDD